MNFLALLLGLGVERLLTHLFHLREFHWLDPFFDWAFVTLSRTSRWFAAAGILLVVLVATLPLFLVAYFLEGTLADIPYFLFAVGVLLFSLGPHDLLDEGNDFCDAINSGDISKARALARDLVEDTGEHVDLSRVDEAIFIQANNRIFSVVFWFVVLGPVGAWLFRVTDLMRHRSTCELPRLSHETTQRITAEPIDGASLSIFYLHGLLAWIPSRLLVLGYMLAGSFDGALAGFRAYYARPAVVVSYLSDDVLSCVGSGAVGEISLVSPVNADTNESDNDPLFLSAASERAAAAVNLVRRTLWLIWCPVLAVLTLTDWIF
jgi:membrane protein required for beta-lactamase induction